MKEYNENHMTKKELDKFIELSTPHYNGSLLNDVLSFQKEYQMEEFSLIDVISEFCLKKNIDIEYLSDKIKNDIFFKEYLYQDLVRNNYIRDEETKSEIENEIKNISDWV